MDSSRPCDVEVDIGQPSHQQRMLRSDRQFLEPASFKLRHQSINVGVQLTQSNFNCCFPNGCATNKNFVCVRDEFSSGFGERPMIRNRP